LNIQRKPGSGLQVLEKEVNIMITAVQFQHRISEIDLSALQQPGSDRLQELENQLRQIEQDINREIHVIRSEYKPRIDTASRGGVSRVVVSNRHASDRYRAEEVTRLETERDEKIAPLQEVKQKVDGLLEQVETARARA
jgi:hypothetical protein